MIMHNNYQNMTIADEYGAQGSNQALSRQNNSSLLKIPGQD